MFDIVGVAVLIVLIALFAFLTVRAWKINRVWLKWISTFFTALLTLIPAALLVLALIGFSKLNKRYDNPLVTMQIAGTADQIARGQQLANICAGCHSPGSELPLSGSNFVAKFDFPPLGTLYAPNLTPAGNIQDWTDAEVIRAIREGVHKDGRSLLVMPSSNFRNMSDEDVQALVAYLRSQPPAGQPLPENHLNVLGAIFMNLSDFRTALPPAGKVIAPQPGTIEYGKYMVDILACRDCHGDQLQGRVDNGQPGPPAGPNLTKILPQWTEEQFMTFFNSGTFPGGGQVPVVTMKSGFSEPRMPWTEVRAATTDDELKDMFAYLHSLTPQADPAN